MFTLILDTSSERAFVALARDFDVLFITHLPFGLQNSKHLFSAIEGCFKRANLGPADLKAIGVGVGPGSYTGIRVGVAAAQGLALGRDIPIIGFSSLAGFTAEEPEYASLIDAKMGGVYVLEKGGSTPFLCQLEELPSYPCVVGPKLKHLGLKNAYEKAPCIQTLAQIVEKKWQENQQMPLEIFYLR